MGEEEKGMKLANFTNPLNGSKGNLLNVGDWTSNIMGVIFLLVIFATGQNLAKAISSKVPVIDSSVEPLITRPQAASTNQKYII